MAPIHYPVVQGRDNEPYLHQNPTGEYSINSTLFADYRNDVPGVDRNYIIYGHNMKSGAIFASLLQYKDPAYYNAHPHFYFLTPPGNYQVELYTAATIERNHLIYDPQPVETDL